MFEESATREGGARKPSPPFVVRILCDNDNVPRLFLIPIFLFCAHGTSFIIFILAFFLLLFEGLHTPLLSQKPISF